MENDLTLNEVLRTVTYPVVQELLADVQVSEIRISASFEGEEVLFSLTVRGEEFGFWIRTPGQEAEAPNALRHRLADALSDWISETSFGWGELRPHSF